MIQRRTPPVDDTYYPASDGKPLGETPQHIQNMFYSLDPLSVWYAGDPMAFVAANMFVYYERGNNRRHVSPDCFVTLGIPKVTDPPRERYLLWEEGKGPDAVFEYTSASTRDEDLDTKRTIYQNILRVREYFLFDPNDEYLDPPLQGHRLVNGLFQPIKPVNGRLPSKVLGLHVERDGELLRFWNPATGQRLPIPPETRDALALAEAARREEAMARRREVRARRLEEKARQLAESARSKEEQARLQLEEARRQDALEIERLRRELAELRRRTPDQP